MPQREKAEHYTEIPLMTREWFEGLRASEVKTLEVIGQLSADQIVILRRTLRIVEAGGTIGKILVWAVAGVVSVAVGSWGVIKAWIEIMATIKGAK